MNIFSIIFSTCFVFLGAFILLVALLIVLVGAIGVLRIIVQQVFNIDLIEWRATYSKKHKKITEKETEKI